MTEDLKALWRRQAPDGADETPDLDVLRDSVRVQLARVRRARILLLAVSLAGAALTTVQALHAPTTLLRLGEALSALGFLLLQPLGWRRLALETPDTAQACVAYLRQSLLRRRHAARGGWIALAAPLLPGMAVTLAGLAVAAGRDWRPLTPILALIGLWLAILLVLQAREAAKVSVEIARLDRISGGSESA